MVGADFPEELHNSLCILIQNNLWEFTFESLDRMILVFVHVEISVDYKLYYNFHLLILVKLQ